MSYAVHTYGRACSYTAQRLYVHADSSFNALMHSRRRGPVNSASRNAEAPGARRLFSALSQLAANRPHNNDNHNSMRDSVHGAVIMTISHWRSSAGSSEKKIAQSTDVVMDRISFAVVTLANVWSIRLFRCCLLLICT